MKKIVFESLNEFVNRGHNVYDEYEIDDPKELEAVEFLRTGLEQRDDSNPLPQPIEDYLETAINRLVPQRMAKMDIGSEFNYEVWHATGENTMFDDPVTYAMAYSDYLDELEGIGTFHPNK